VLVLGLDGFIGRSISRLIDPASSFAVGQDQALIENPVLLDAAMDEAGADRVLFSWHPPGLDTNCAAGQLITALRNVLEVCRVRRAGLIFLSGQQVFAGHGGSGPISFSETDALQPAGAAGDGLFLAETLINQYKARHGLTALLVRASHVYGPEDERPGILNTLVNKALARQEIVTHRYQNGAPFIDLIHVRDLARALRLAIEKRLTGVLHIASGNPVATDELARLIVRKLGSSSVVSSIEMPANYSMVQLESTIAGPTLEWRPGIDLETGLSELIDHARPRVF
jgi:UDP-glucose 4-epimerase